MIFCITGNTHQPFNRLINLSLELSSLAQEDLIIQNSVQLYGQAPSHIQTGIIDHHKFVETMSKANFVVTHAGAGTLRMLNTYNKKSICVPRLKVYGEHVNDHQVQIAREFMKRGLTFLPDDYAKPEILPADSYQGFKSMNFTFGQLSEHDLNAEIVRIVRSIVGH